MDRFTRMLAAAAVAISLTGADAADLYVAPGGNDANPGTKEQPFASLGEHEAVGGIEEQLVVVAAPVKPRPAGDGPQRQGGEFFP